MVQSRRPEGTQRCDLDAPRGRRDDVGRRDRHGTARSPRLDDRALSRSGWARYRYTRYRRLPIDSQCPLSTSVLIGSSKAWMRNSIACTPPTASTACSTRPLKVPVSFAAIRSWLGVDDAAAAGRHAIKPAFIDRLHEGEDGAGA